MKFKGRAPARQTKFLILKSNFKVQALNCTYECLRERNFKRKELVI